MTLQETAASLSRDEVVALLAEKQELAARNAELQQQLGWLKRQLFGPSSERRLLGDPDSRQLTIGEAFTTRTDAASAPTISVPRHTRRRPQDPTDRASESSRLRYDASVPVEEIEIPNPEIADLPPGSYDIVGEKITERLAQRRGAYVVLVYKRKVAKRKDTGAFLCPEAPASVFDKSIADVSFIAGLLIDKFRFALPLYRQHQRLAETGVHISRSTLTLLVQRAALLLEPVYDALQASVLSSKLLLMDETPIKAGHRRTRKGSGKMKTGYFWPVYGDQSEIVFPFSESRSHSVVEEILGDFKGTLVTDGYEAYERFDSKVRELVHALCWSHTRRYFVKAEAVEPELANKGLDFIAELYRHEATIRNRGLSDVKKLEARAEHSKPVVERFFEWLKDVHREHLLLPSNPLTKAASYALEREAGLRVFLGDPGVPLDTNGLEREIRPLAIGRKNWLFAWTEVGAKYVGIFHSLIATCRLQSVDPYTYLVDVLQRVATHPARDVGQLTPRMWKQHFESNPLRSDVDRRQYSVR